MRRNLSNRFQSTKKQKQKKKTLFSELFYACFFLIKGLKTYKKRRHLFAFFTERSLEFCADAAHAYSIAGRDTAENPVATIQ